MRNIETIYERSTINFDNLVNSEQAKKLLSHLSKERRCRITYNYQRTGAIPLVLNEKEYDVSFGGMISSSNPFFVASFELIEQTDDYSRFSGLRFLVAPGTEEIDYSEEEIDFWDDTRRIVKHYFSDKITRRQNIHFAE